MSAPVTGEDPLPTAPLSWRDVYKAVGDSESRVIAAIQSAVAPLTTSSADHEVRLRNIEQHGTPEAKEALMRVGLAEAAIMNNTRAIDRAADQRSGIFTALGTGKTVLVTVAALVGPVLAAIAMIK